MRKYISDLVVKPLPKGYLQEVVQDFTYCDEELGIYLIIPKGFITDFASVPRCFQIIFPPAAGKYNVAAVIHDYLYYTGIYSRKYSDYIFYHAMKERGVNKIKAQIIQKAVRIGGQQAQQKQRRKEKKGKKREY